MRMIVKYCASLGICVAFGWLLSANAVSEPPGPDLAEAKATYDENCASCHGPDGRAKTFRAKFNKARDLTEPQWQDGISDASLLESIKAGRGKMPAFLDKLSDAQLEGLVRYVRSFRR
jgi:cytochrome c6